MVYIKFSKELQDFMEDMQLKLLVGENKMDINIGLLKILGELLGEKMD